jgi:hypothetical protein
MNFQVLVGKWNNWSTHFPSIEIVDTYENLSFLRVNISQVLVAHACNPSYSGGRDQEDHVLKPAWANSSWDPIFKKRAGGVSQGVGPEFKPQYHKKKVVVAGWVMWTMSH